MVQRPLTGRALAAAAATLLAGCVASGGSGLAPAPGGYLSPQALDRLVPLSQAPAPAEEGVLVPVAPGTDRWWLATAQVELRPPWAAQHFDCALEARLTRTPRPALARIMARLSADAAGLASRRPADPGAAPRPFVLEGLEPCVRASAAMRASPSRPAAEAVVAGAYGELFAALAPDAAGAVRRTAREIGYSRVVCRLNAPADVEAGLAAGAALYRAAASQDGFAADFEAARYEVAAARAAGPGSPGCAAERRASRQWRAPPAPG